MAHKCYFITHKDTFMDHLLTFRLFLIVYKLLVLCAIYYTFYIYPKDKSTTNITEVMISTSDVSCCKI